MYDDGILVNGPVVMSTTLTFATLGLSILGVLLQVLAGILLLRGGGYLAKEKGRRGLAACVPHCGHRFPGFWRVPDCFTDPRFPFRFLRFERGFAAQAQCSAIQEAPGL